MPPRSVVEWHAVPCPQVGATLMAGEQNENVANMAGEAQKVGRERSSIEFPYGDLDDAVKLAKAVRDVGGQSCTLDQLAAQLKQSANSGAFRLRTSYPRIFGLAEVERGTIRLTELGMRIVDPTQETRARVDAFIRVPLYKAIYDKYRGFTLPPAAALEREMAGLGVSSKQTDKARQAFDRSARQAGFYWSGTDRLVMPALKGDAPASRPLDTGTPGADAAGQGDRGSGQGGSGGNGGDGSGLTGDPLIDAMVKKLPKAGAQWPDAERKTWLKMIEMAFDLAYGARAC
jgi:hypothetical protein